jgi:hypothetical protein
MREAEGASPIAAVDGLAFARSLESRGKRSRPVAADIAARGSLA